MKNRGPSGSAADRRATAESSKLATWRCLSAKKHVDAEGWLILPGQIAFLEDWSPAASVPSKQIESLLARGVTTVIGCVDLSNNDVANSIGEARELPFNWGFVGRINKTGGLLAADLVERAAAAANRGLIAIATNRANEEVWQQLDRLGSAARATEPTERPTFRPSATYQEQLQQTARLFKLLNLHANRGRVGRDAMRRPGDVQSPWHRGLDDGR